MADVKAGMGTRKLVDKHGLSESSIRNIKRTKTFKGYQGMVAQRAAARKSAAPTKVNRASKTADDKLTKELKTIEVKQDAQVTQELLEQFDEQLRQIRLAQEMLNDRFDKQAMGLKGIDHQVDNISGKLSIVYRALPNRWRKRGGKA